MKNEVASLLKKDQLAPTQHVTPVQRPIVPLPPSKPSPQKIIQESNNDQMDSKNFQTTFILNGDQQTNQIKNVFEFIQKPMEKLSTYEKQFQEQLDIEMSQTVM